MRLPNAEKAVIDLCKLRDYCLNPSHFEGRHKARVFAATLGIGQQDADWLCDAIQKAIQKAPVIHSEHHPYGVRYTVDIALFRENANVVVRTGWMVRANEDFPRLVTCFVL
jgi:hypothetical protein